MKFFPFAIAFLLAGCASQPADKTIVLFNGKTLRGWHQHNDVPAPHVGGRWSVVEGAIVGEQEPPGSGGLLVTDRKFKDFVLKLEVKQDYPTDTGIFLRVGDDGKSHQISFDNRPRGDIGGIYLPWTQGKVFTNPTGVRHFKQGEWNQVEVRMQGEPARIQCTLNGHMITDFQHTEASTRGVPTTGSIGIQVHPNVPNLVVWKPGNKVQFRHISIKRL
jgi:hypothetical protein